MTNDLDSSDIAIREFRREEFFRPDWSLSVIRVENTPDEYPLRYDHLNQRQFWKIMYVVSGRGAMIINNRRYAADPPVRSDDAGAR